MIIKNCWKVNKVSWDINIKAKREISIFEANITYNLSPMYYKCLDKELGLKIFDKMTCKEALPILQKAIEDLIDNKEEYEKLNPENGWGNYEGLLITFLEMRKCCIDNPDGILELS